MDRKEWASAGVVVAVTSLVVATLAYINDLSSNDSPAASSTTSVAVAAPPPANTTSEPAPATDDAGGSGGTGRSQDQLSREPLQLTRVDVTLPGTLYKVGDGLYQLGRWDDDMLLDYLWTGRSNYGTVEDGSNCEIVGTAVRKSDGVEVSRTRSSSCDQTVSAVAKLPVGQYQIKVQFSYQGQTVTGTTDVTILPHGQ